MWSREGVHIVGRAKWQESLFNSWQSWGHYSACWQSIAKLGGLIGSQCHLTYLKNVTTPFWPTPLHHSGANHLRWSIKTRCFFWRLSNWRGGALKNGYFTVRLAIRGVSPLGPGRKNKWNFDPFLNCLVLGYSKHTYLIVRGLKNAFIMSFTPLLYRYPTILWQSREQQQVETEEMRILVVGWKFLFSCVKSVPEHI